MAGHTNAAQSFWDRAAKKQEAELEKVGYKFSKEEEEERQSMRTVHENMAGSQDAPEFEADGEAAVKVPHWLDKCGAFDHSDMMYTKGQQQADNERRARAKQEEDSAVRAFRADAAKAPAPSVVVAPRVKTKVDEGPAPVLKRRRVDAAAPADGPDRPGTSARPAPRCATPATPAPPACCARAAPAHPRAHTHEHRHRGESREP